MQNVRGLITNNSRETLELIEEYSKLDKVILMNIMETWLHAKIKKEADIEGFQTFRCDRSSKKRRGGVAIYVYDKLEIGQIWKKNSKKCEMIGIEIKDIQTTNFVVYRPPNTKREEFKVILETLRNVWKKIGSHNNTIIMTGDFNFGFIEWTNNSSGACSYKFKKETSKDEKEQFMDLMALCDEYCLLQIIEDPTRGENTLDLFFTNEVSLINNIEIYASSKSDHSKIEISTGYIIDQENKQNFTAEFFLLEM